MVCHLSQTELCKEGSILAEFKVGDIVVLSAGSMRMAVELVEEDNISTVWCNEGVIGRDKFSSVLLKKWEHREEEKNKAASKTKATRTNDRNDFTSSARTGKTRGNTGWDGKVREKKFFRKTS